MNVFDLSKLGELVVNVVLLSLLMDTRHKEDPTFDGSLRSGLASIPAGVDLAMRIC
jgi:hypothetical protein